MVRLEGLGQLKNPRLKNTSDLLMYLISYQNPKYHKCKIKIQQKHDENILKMNKNEESSCDHELAS
jgi:hypothetical protein